MVKLLLFCLRVTNSKLKNIKLHLKLLTGKLKKQNADLESWSFEISLLKWHIIQFRITEKNIGKLNFVIIRFRSCSQEIIYDHDITQHVECVILLRFFVFRLLCCKYICDIYLSVLDSNGLCKFNNIFIHKITEDSQ